mgnify:CR=1 FL=1
MDKGYQAFTLSGMGSNPMVGVLKKRDDSVEVSTLVYSSIVGSNPARSTAVWSLCLINKERYTVGLI